MARGRCAGARLLLLAACLALCAAHAAAAGLLLARPDGDCLAPALDSLSYNFWPKPYQLQSIRSSGGADRSSGDTGLSTTVEFAQDFSVTYHGTYKVVENKRANESYLLYQCGTPNPLAADALNTEASALAGGKVKVFEVPLVSVAVTDSNAAAFLAELGLVDRVAFASQYSVNPCLQAVHACGPAAVGASAPEDYDPSPANDASHDAELAQWRKAAAAQGPQVDAIFTSSPTANPKSIAITAFADPGALNRAEWVKFVAVFFNKEVEANALFNTIEADYQRLNASARDAAAKAGRSRATVAWLAKAGDVATLSYAPFKAQLVADAGGVMLAPADVEASGGAKAAGPSPGFTFNVSTPAGAAALAQLLQQVDVIVDDSYSFGSANLPNATAFAQQYRLGAADAAAIPALAAGKVYAPNGRLAARMADGDVASDWFERAVARPDLVLADFVQAITPAAAPANASPTWLRQLAATPSALALAGPAECASVKPAAAGAGAGSCSRAAPARICPNAYRDCASGEMKTVTDPSQRCDARTTCPAASLVSSAAGSGTAAPAGAAATSSSAAGVTAAARLQALAPAAAVLLFAALA